MHDEALAWVRAHATDDSLLVLDIGGRDINGTTKDLFPNAEWVTLDILPGEGVSIVADAATWEPDREYDLIVSTECFEHAEGWRDIVKTIYRALRPGGRCVLTMAGPGRQVHSGVDGDGVLHPGEYYGNVDPDHLRAELEATGFVDIIVDSQVSPADTRAVASKPH